MNEQKIQEKLFKISKQYHEWLSRGALFRYLMVFLLSIPILNNFLYRSIYAVCFSIDRYRENRNYKDLYSLLFSRLETKHLKDQHDKWWFLIRLGVAITQERQINMFIIDVNVEDKLIELADNGPLPKIGYDVAYTFVGQSLWLFERGNIAEAIDKIQIAIDAEDRWGYSEYLLGWYGLFTVGVDSVEHFSKAVNLDWGFLHRMKRDRTCMQYPEVISQVQKNVLIRTKG